MTAGPAWVCLGLGSNLGDRLSYLREALVGLKDFVTVESVSSVYETDPIGYVDQPPFLNMALKGLTDLTPPELLKSVKTIEAKAGRQPTLPQRPRVLDIDILLFGYGDGALFVHRSPELVVPHPRMHERGFVLVPLAEITPELRHPVLGETIHSFADKVGSVGVRLFAPPPVLS